MRQADEKLLAVSEVAGHLDINFLKSNILIFPFLLILSFSHLCKKQLRIILFSSLKAVNKRFGQIEIFVSISHVHKSVIFLRTAYAAFLTMLAYLNQFFAYYWIPYATACTYYMERLLLSGFQKSSKANWNVKNSGA